MRDPGRLDNDDLDSLARLQAACASAATAYPRRQEITRIIREQQADRLDPWLAAAATSGLPDLASFAAGLQRERIPAPAAMAATSGRIRAQPAERDQ